MYSLTGYNCKNKVAFTSEEDTNEQLGEQLTVLLHQLLIAHILSYFLQEPIYSGTESSPQLSKWLCHNISYHSFPMRITFRLRKTLMGMALEDCFSKKSHNCSNNIKDLANETFTTKTVLLF